MGCFDYTCDGCDGENCDHTSGQNRPSTVIIEVPLTDGTCVYLQGEYEEYGYVSVTLGEENHEFYLEQFTEYFQAWKLSENLMATKVYTVKEKVHVSELDEDEEDDIEVTKRYDCQPSKAVPVPLTKDILSKCVRTEKLKVDIEKVKSDIELCKRDIEIAQNILKGHKEVLKKLKKILKEANPKKETKSKEETATTKPKKSSKTLNV